MKSKIIYKRTNNETVQTWQVFYEGNRFWTVEGLLGGKLTESLPTYCEGKNIGRANETSPEAQAKKEAESRYKKKLKEGYTPDVNKVDEAKSAFFRPMLAKKWQDRKHKVSYPVYCQPKLDGIRCIATKNGFFSRNGERHKSVPHIERYLAPFFVKYPDAILDGELYADKYNNDFNELSSIIMKGIQGNKPITVEDLKKSEEAIQYWVYDFPVYTIGHASQGGTFCERMSALQSLFFSGDSNILKIVPTHVASSEARVTELFEAYLEEGYEGQIIRIDDVYENKRSWFLLKHKSFEDAEWTILGFEEGKGNRAGTIGKTHHQTFDGKHFSSNVKGSHVWLRRLWNDRANLIGKMATIRYPNLTPDGKPRFPFVIKIRDYE